MPGKVGAGLLSKLLTFQKNEITEYRIYTKLSRVIKGEKNKEVLRSIAEDEYRHYKFYRGYTEQDVKPDRWRIFKFYWTARIFGLTFGLKLMEKGEEQAKNVYEKLVAEIPEIRKIFEDEDSHEKELLNLIEEERLNYVSSIVLGLNDALVELTGTLAGLTFALQNTRLIALAGMITGVAASFSMGASEYLSTKAEDNDSEKAFKSSLYTGTAYILTVILLIMPYLLLANYFFSLILTIAAAILVILIFNFYISVAKDLSFKKRFFEMSVISLGVAALTFAIGYFIRIFLGIEV